MIRFRVRLVCDPDVRGEVISHEGDNTRVRSPRMVRGPRPASTNAPERNRTALKAVSGNVFAVGSLVELSCPGYSGRVTGALRGKVTVHWPDLDITTQHTPESLAVPGGR